ncbi:MAG: hypothetical protein RBS34_06375 [Desulfofustis sp.]|jgi:ABC-type nitrate/sulfonate/bicarbonate transport system substrate-binding protein|nr:hypothetical protein [Desulfofustis sp.]
MLESHGASRMLASFHDILPHWVFTGLYFSNTFIQENPNIVKATVAGLLKSFDFIKNHEQQARMHMPKYTGMDLDTCMISALREYSSPYKPKELLERQRDVMLRYGYLDKKLDIDHMIDYSFLPEGLRRSE